MKSLVNAPPSFEAEGKRAVFVRFVWSHHDLKFDAGAGTLTATSTICFDALLGGHAIIDIEAEDSQLTSASVDGRKVDLLVVHSPPSNRNPELGTPVTEYRMLSEPVLPGRHLLIVEHRIVTRVRFSRSGTIDAYFELSDRPGLPGFSLRPFVERFVPANLEFDRYPSTWHIWITGTRVEHAVVTNGALHGDEAFRFEINFPRYFTSSSPFFLLCPRTELGVHRFVVPNLTSPPIHVRVASLHSHSVESPMDFESETRRQLMELESSFGPFPYRQLLIYAGDEFPMEYAGAVVSSIASLRHEITHCYFGRCVAPTNGDAGWIDEGIARWFEMSASPIDSPLSIVKNLGAYSPYRRFTEESAWSTDAAVAVIRRLDHLLTDRGGMAEFLRRWIRKRAFRSVTTQDFQRAVERFGRQSFAAEVFDHHVYGIE